ncbi:MAG: VOC family protein [Ignavibacteriales bacterium]|nr:VOC family protein [Ignavibacteriales bacterium]
MDPKNPKDQSTLRKIEPRLEHIALNISDPMAAAKWYCERLGMKVMRKGPPPVNAHFISDSAGNMILELYSNTTAPVIDYASLNPLCLHIAFIANDLKVIRDTLVIDGAKVVDDIETIPNGDQILMMRDPWGLSLQFVKRAEPMLK